MATYKTMLSPRPAPLLPLPSTPPCDPHRNLGPVSRVPVQPLKPFEEFIRPLGRSGVDNLVHCCLFILSLKRLFHV
jgi:hypothetical protein